MPDYGLSSQQLAVICALSNGATMTDAAAEAGVHRNTISNWRRNFLPFQQALAGAQYDRALLFREKTEALVNLAVEALHDILTDPSTPPSVRLKAALAILQTASTPPAPKKQVEVEIEKIVVTRTEPAPAPPMHNAAQSTQAPTAESVAEALHNPAQSIRPGGPGIVGPKIGRNVPCPCGSGKKYKHCCLGQAPAGRTQCAA